MKETNIKSNRPAIIILIVLGLVLWSIIMRSCGDRAQRAEMINSLLLECRTNGAVLNVMAADGTENNSGLKLKVKALNVFIGNERKFSFSKSAGERWDGIKRKFREKGLVMAGIVDAELKPGNALEMAGIYRALFDMLLTAAQNGYDFKYRESAAAGKTRQFEEAVN